MQETWIAVLRGIDGFEARSSLKTWLYRILTNRAKTAGMREGRCVPDSAFTEREIDGYRPEVPADRFHSGDHPQWPQHWRRPPLAWERELEDGVVRREAVGVASDAIDELAPRQRLVIILRDVECWTSEEVCDVLDITSANQRVLLHRARSQVRQRLESLRDRRGMTAMLIGDLPCQELVELITDYLEDALPAHVRARFEAHLAACPFCATYLEQMRATIELTGHLHEDDLGTVPRAALLEAFRDWRAERSGGCNGSP